MSSTTNESIVLVGNRIEDVDPEVVVALEGLAFLTGAFLTAGHNDVIPQDPEGMQGFDRLIAAFNKGLADPQTSDRLTREHADISERLIALESGLGSTAFQAYMWDLGCLATMYSLKPKDDTRPNVFELTIVGFD